MTGVRGSGSGCAAVGAFRADAEVQLLHSLHLVADSLQRADGAVGRESLEDGGQGAGDGGGFLRDLQQAGVVVARSGEEEHAGVQDVGVLPILPDVAAADGVQADPSPEGFAGDAHLFAAAFGRDADHVALGVDVVLGELDVLQDAIDPFAVVVEHAHAQDGDAGEVGVGTDLAQVGAPELDPVAVAELRGRGEEHAVERAVAGGAQLVGGVLLQDELAGAEVAAAVRFAVIPGAGRGGTEGGEGVADEGIIQLHRVRRPG